MARAGYAIVDKGGNVIAMYTSLPNAIRWPNGDITEPATPMARAGHSFVERVAELLDEDRDRKLGSVSRVMEAGKLVERAELVARTDREKIDWDVERRTAALASGEVFLRAADLCIAEVPSVEAAAAVDAIRAALVELAAAFQGSGSEK